MCVFMLMCICVCVHTEVSCLPQLPCALSLEMSLWLNEKLRSLTNLAGHELQGSTFLPSTQTADVRCCAGLYIWVLGMRTQALTTFVAQLPTEPSPQAGFHTNPLTHH